MARPRAGRFRDRVEDLVLPSPALHVGPLHLGRALAARRARAVDVVLSGHEHFYERIHPQHGITYFVSGAAGSLRAGDIRQSTLTAKGFDTDYSFILMEISGNELYFQALSRTGETVDAGVISRKVPLQP